MPDEHSGITSNLFCCCFIARRPGLAEHPPPDSPWKMAHLRRIPELAEAARLIRFLYYGRRYHELADAGAVLGNQP